MTGSLQQSLGTVAFFLLLTNCVTDKAKPVEPDPAKAVGEPTPSHAAAEKTSATNTKKAAEKKKAAVGEDGAVEDVVSEEPEASSDAEQDTKPKHAAAENIDDSEGGLTSDEISRVISSKLNEIRNCYEELLGRQPDAKGKIRVGFTIDGGGGVIRNAVIDQGTTLTDDDMQTCVVDKVNAWQFPEPRQNKEVEVTYPFVFNPL